MGVEHPDISRWIVPRRTRSGAWRAAGVGRTCEAARRLETEEDSAMSEEILGEILGDLSRVSATHVTGRGTKQNIAGSTTRQARSIRRLQREAMKSVSERVARVHAG